MNNEEAWNALCNLYDIVECVKRDGFFRISAGQIKEFREPRLMTKFDFASQLPSIFRNEHLSILPITRGDYVIADIKTFEQFQPSDNIIPCEKTIPTSIESLDFASITSEALAINCAYVSNILSDFVEDETLVPTINGRMGSDDFSFEIQRSTEGKTPLPILVTNSQIEIDGGFEGENSLILLEAKNKLCSEFMVRQLYYPYRKWEKRISKKVRPVFLEYSNGIFHLREYVFETLEKYNSLVLVKEKKYRLRDKELRINTQTLQDLLNRIPFAIEPECPFPQADSFERVISLCETLYNNDEDIYTKEILNYDIDFTGQESFTHRQVDYYTNAAIYLGLVEKVEGSSPVEFVLSAQGQRIMSMRSITERQIKFIESIITHQAFARVLRLYLENAEAPTRNEIIDIMKDSNLWHINTDIVYNRRASTVKSWVEWIIGTMDE